MIPFSDERIKMSGNCQIKTQSGHYREFFVTLVNNELYQYISKEHSNHEKLHILTGVYISDK
jgi:hypothetical protein